MNRWQYLYVTERSETLALDAVWQHHYQELVDHHSHDEPRLMAALGDAGWELVSVETLRRDQRGDVGAPIYGLAVHRRLILRREQNEHTECEYRTALAGVDEMERAAEAARLEAARRESKALEAARRESKALEAAQLERESSMRHATRRAVDGATVSVCPHCGTAQWTNGRGMVPCSSCDQYYELT